MGYNFNGRLGRKNNIMNTKKIIKLIISIAIGLFIGLMYGVYSFIVAIFFPEMEETLIKIPRIILIVLLSIGVVICFSIFFVSFFRELNFIKLYNNELAYIGFSEDLYNAALKRKKRFEIDKYGVGYIGSINLLANYHLLHEQYDEAAKLLEEIDIQELKKKSKIDSANPSNDKLTTFLSLLDCLIAVYSFKGDKEKEEQIASIFNPYYNAFIHKHENLTNILYEAKLNDLLYHGEFTEALSILDILKSSDECFYNILYLDYLFYKKETDLSIIENAVSEALNGSESSRTAAFFKEIVEQKKEFIYRNLNNDKVSEE